MKNQEIINGCSDKEFFNACYHASGLTLDSARELRSQGYGLVWNGETPHLADPQGSACYWPE